MGGGLLSLSLSRCSHFLVSLWAKFKGLFTHFVVNFSYFIVVFSRLFTCKRHFLGHYAFLKFLNASFLGFCALFVILSLCKKATQRVARRKPQQKNPQRLKENLPFLAQYDSKRVIASRFCENGGFCHFERSEKSKEFKICFIYGYFACAQYDKIYDTKSVWYDKFGLLLKNNGYFTQILGTKFTNFTRFYGLPRSLCSLAMMARQKFKFFTQNSKHFTNSTHFINLSQILSPTQGFFIFLPQVFAQCKLINIILQGGHYV